MSSELSAFVDQALRFEPLLILLQVEAILYLFFGIYIAEKFETLGNFVVGATLSFVTYPLVFQMLGIPIEDYLPVVVFSALGGLAWIVAMKIKTVLVLIACFIFSSIVGFGLWQHKLSEHFGNLPQDPWIPIIVAMSFGLLFVFVFTQTRRLRTIIGTVLSSAFLITAFQIDAMDHLRSFTNSPDETDFEVLAKHVESFIDWLNLNITLFIQELSEMSIHNITYMGETITREEMNAVLLRKMQENPDLYRLVMSGREFFFTLVGLGSIVQLILYVTLVPRNRQNA